MRTPSSGSRRETDIASMPPIPIAASTRARRAKRLTSMRVESRHRGRPAHDLTHRLHRGHRQGRVDRANARPRVGECRRLHLAAQRHAAITIRRRRSPRSGSPTTHGVDLRNGFGIQRSLLHVPNDADDAHPGRVLGRVAPYDPLPDWVGRPPDPARHGVVDDRHQLRLDGVFDAKWRPRVMGCQWLRSNAPRPTDGAALCGSSRAAGGSCSIVIARRSRTPSGSSVEAPTVLTPGTCERSSSRRE